MFKELENLQRYCLCWEWMEKHEFGDYIKYKHLKKIIDKYMILTFVGKAQDLTDVELEQLIAMPQLNGQCKVELVLVLQNRINEKNKLEAGK